MVSSQEVPEKIYYQHRTDHKINPRSVSYKRQTYRTTNRIWVKQNRFRVVSLNIGVNSDNITKTNVMR